MDAGTDITSETLDSLIIVNGSIGRIHDRFMRHWQGTGYECTMRRGSGAPTKERGCIDDATPVQALLYLDYFIDPYLRELEDIETAIPKTKGFLREGLTEKVKSSIAFASELT